MNEDTQSTIHLQDLKCGNVLNYISAEGDDLISIIDYEDIKWLAIDPVSFNDVHSPIILTEEILEKLGFTDNAYKSGYIGKDFRSGGIYLDFVLSRPFTKGEWNSAYTYDLLSNRFVNINYVHELQNLYYSLAGEMLKL